MSDKEDSRQIYKQSDSDSQNNSVNIKTENNIILQQQTKSPSFFSKLFNFSKRNSEQQEQQQQQEKQQQEEEEQQKLQKQNININESAFPQQQNSNVQDKNFVNKNKDNNQEQDKQNKNLNTLKLFSSMNQHNADNINSDPHNHNQRRVGLLSMGFSKLLIQPTLYQISLKKINVNIQLKEYAEACIIILIKTNKTPEEISYLTRAIQNLAIFKDDGEDKKVDLSQVWESQQAVLQLFKGLKHQFFKKRETIFHLGDYGTLYFIVLIGKVFTMIPDGSKTEIQTEDQNFNRKQKKLQDIDKLNDEQFIQQQFPLMKNVHIFESGGAFGDIALLTKSQRTATMVAMEDTHCMTLSKQAFDQITGVHKEQILQENLSFLKQFQFFKDISNSSLISNIMLNIHIITYINKQIIYEEKDHTNHIYFIKQGEVVLSKLVRSQNQDNIDLQILEGINQLNARTSINNQGAVKRINYAFLGANTFFGEEEITQKKNARESKAICGSDNCQVYKLSKEKLFETLKKYSMISVYKANVEEKQLRHEAQLRKVTQTKTFNNLANLKAKKLFQLKSQDKMISQHQQLESNNNLKIESDQQYSEIFQITRTHMIGNQNYQQRNKQKRDMAKSLSNTASNFKLANFCDQTNKIMEAQEQLKEKIIDRNSQQNKIHLNQNKNQQQSDEQQQQFFSQQQPPQPPQQSQIQCLNMIRNNGIYGYLGDDRIRSLINSNNFLARQLVQDYLQMKKSSQLGQPASSSQQKEQINFISQNSSIIQNSQQISKNQNNNTKQDVNSNNQQLQIQQQQNNLFHLKHPSMDTIFAQQQQQSKSEAHYSNHQISNTLLKQQNNYQDNYLLLPMQKKQMTNQYKKNLKIIQKLSSSQLSQSLNRQQTGNNNKTISSNNNSEQKQQFNQQTTQQPIPQLFKSVDLLKRRVSTETNIYSNQISPVHQNRIVNNNQNNNLNSPINISLNSPQSQSTQQNKLFFVTSHTTKSQNQNKYQQKLKGFEKDSLQIKNKKTLSCDEQQLSILLDRLQIPDKLKYMVNINNDKHYKLSVEKNTKIHKIKHNIIQSISFLNNKYDDTINTIQKMNENEQYTQNLTLSDKKNNNHKNYSDSTKYQQFSSFYKQNQQIWKGHLSPSLRTATDIDQKNELSLFFKKDSIMFKDNDN